MCHGELRLGVTSRGPAMRDCKRDLLVQANVRSRVSVQKQSTFKVPSCMFCLLLHYTLYAWSVCFKHYSKHTLFYRKESACSWVNSDGWNNAGKHAAPASAPSRDCGLVRLISFTLYRRKLHVVFIAGCAGKVTTNCKVFHIVGAVARTLYQQRICFWYVVAAEKPFLIVVWDKLMI